MKYGLIRHCPRQWEIPAQGSLLFFDNVGTYCIRLTKRPARGERVDVESIRGVCNTPLHGYLSDNRLDMMKLNTYLSAIVRDNGKYLTKESAIVRDVAKRDAYSSSIV